MTVTEIFNLWKRNPDQVDVSREYSTFDELVRAVYSAIVRWLPGAAEEAVAEVAPLIARRVFISPVDESEIITIYNPKPEDFERPIQRSVSRVTGKEALKR